MVKAPSDSGSAFIASQIPIDLKAAKKAGLLKMPLGFQVWTVRQQLVKDFPGTLKMMAGLGYESMEMCSPPGYESSGFGPLMKLSAKEMKQIIHDAGLICPELTLWLRRAKAEPGRTNSICQRGRPDSNGTLKFRII